jgi:predicted enzyme related to lactoylglutathione lyase
MARLSYVNVFAADIVALSQFYMDVFGFPEIEAIRSPIFRGIDAGSCCIGFNAHDAYDLLKLDAYRTARGVKFLLNIDVEDMAAVERVTERAVSLGAALIKAPYRTYYNWYQSVLLDPEQNVFRVNHMLPAGV